MLNHLAPGFVIAHFSLSLVILVAAFALAWRSTYEPGARPLAADRFGAISLFAVRIVDRSELDDLRLMQAESPTGIGRRHASP